MNGLYQSKLSRKSNQGAVIDVWCPCKGSCTLGCSGKCTGTCAGSCAGNCATSAYNGING